MKEILGFITLVAGFVFLMGLVTHASGTATVLNSASSGLVKLFTLELGYIPASGTQGKPTPVTGK